MEFAILGPLVVMEDGRPVPVTGHKERGLLAILLIHTGEVVSADRLVDDLWGSDAPANPSNALQVVVSRLRRALEPPAAGEVLVTRKPGYTLDIAPEELDAHRFEGLLDEAQRVAGTDPSAASALLKEALSLWRGPALAEFAFDDFARDEVARLEEGRLRAIELKMQADLALGRHDELVGDLTTLVAGHPLRERLRGQLMLALYRSGRQGEALRVFQEGRTALIEELGIDPGPELQALHQQILLQAASLTPSSEPLAAVHRNNLPVQITSFVGRDVELREVTKLLADSRLVTLTGPGGCGKTRLALGVAEGLLEAFRDGVWLAVLADIGDPDQVAPALGAALGLHEGVAIGVGVQSSQPFLSRLLDHLRGRELLVVLDNCEHLVDSCAEVIDQLLRAAPRVQVLATSRERLGVEGEVLWPVPPLGLPTAGEASAERLVQHDAVRLFLERATAVHPAFVLDADTAPAVNHICRRLDGIPLALELAAAWARILPPAQIAARLDDRFSLLVSGSRHPLARHQTLRTAIDWSYELLSVPERELFAQLSVFVGGFTVEAAEGVCGDPATGVLELLSRLVDQSLVVPGDGANARLRMLETLRSYAGERLAEAGAREALQRRHAAYLLQVAEQAAPMLRGTQQGGWLRRLERERANIAAAIDWALHRDPEIAVRLTGALAYFWLIGRHRSEDRGRLNQAVAASGNASAAGRLMALAWAAIVANSSGNPDQAATHAPAAYELATAVGDPWWIALSGAALGMTLGLKGDPRGSELLSEARGRFEAIGERWGASVTCLFLGYVSGFAAGHHEHAAALARQGLNGFREVGDQWGQTMTLELLGFLARRRGAYRDAVAVYEEALGVIRDLGLADEVPYLLIDLGSLQVVLQDYPAAEILFDEALTMGLERGARDTAAHARNGLGLVARWQGRYDQAKELHAQALFFFRDQGFPEETIYSLACLGFVEELRGDLGAAEAFHQESLLLARTRLDELPVALAFEGLACVAAARLRPRRAAVLLGAAESIRTRAGTPLSPHDQLDVERATGAALDALGAETFGGVIDRGREMGTDEAARYAVSGG